MGEDVSTGHRIPAALLPTDGAAGAPLLRPAPEPTHAERARTVVDSARQGTLSTIAVEPAGHPFGSVVNLAFDEAGRPLTFVSDMAVHTRNLLADPRASVLVAEATPDGADPLAGGRVTLVGSLRRLDSEDPDFSGARERFIAAQAQAFYVDYGDFSCYRLDLAAVRYVGGFGRMSWVEVAEYAGAHPDPLRKIAAAAVAHMNADHADALVTCAEAFADVRATSASMTALDRYGFDLVAVTSHGRRVLRIGFDGPLDADDEVRPAMVALVAKARSALVPPH